MKVRRILESSRAQISLLLGNGINQSAGVTGGISWDKLMETLVDEAADRAAKPAEARSKLRSLLVRNAQGQRPASLPEIFAAEIADPVKSFAIWHIHGDRALQRSIRAGLDQYMGMVERLRKLKRPVAREILAEPPADPARSPSYFAAPWLRIFMGCKLWIQGLGLHSDEVSLRWLSVLFWVISTRGDTFCPLRARSREAKDL